MRPVYLLDTNIIVRFLAKDHAEHRERASKLIKLAEEGGCQLVVAPWIIAEVIYTMISYYGAEKSNWSPG